jgi:hypothetical protein
MNSISVTYTYNYQINFATEYKFTTCKKLFNNKTGRRIKQVYNNSCIGYNIRGKFYSLTRLRKDLELIEDYSYALKALGSPTYKLNEK